MSEHSNRIAGLEAENAELRGYKAEADALRADNQRLHMADYDKTDAELRARLEDAELIAWGLANQCIVDQLGLSGCGCNAYIQRGEGDDESPENAEWDVMIRQSRGRFSGHPSMRVVGFYPTLTPEAREALRNAKKDAGE